MTLAAAPFAPDPLARDVLAALDEGRQIPSLAGRHPDLDLCAAYRVTAAIRRLREARGERVVGRKIGFTNTTIWDEYAVHAPIWGYVYDTTLHRAAGPDASLDLSGLVEPRIEPEIMFGLSRAPEPDMEERALLSCIEWAAHGFEIVQSLFAAWRFTAADTVAAFGLHGALLLGEPSPVTAGNAGRWHEALATFEITLARNGVATDEGRAGNVLGGGPLSALRHLVQVLAEAPDAPPLAPGEIVSTGTLTRAFPVAPGETWSTTLSGLPLPGARVGLR